MGSFSNDGSLDVCLSPDKNSKFGRFSGKTKFDSRDNCPTTSKEKLPGDEQEKYKNLPGIRVISNGDAILSEKGYSSKTPVRKMHAPKPSDSSTNSSSNDSNSSDSTDSTDSKICVESLHSTSAASIRQFAIRILHTMKLFFINKLRICSKLIFVSF